MFGSNFPACEAAQQSSLDDIETTRPFEPNHDYYCHTRYPIWEEWNRAYAAYNQIDQVNGKKYLDQLEDCRTYAWFFWNRKSKQVTVMANSCRLRWCPTCARARSHYIAESTMSWLSQTKAPKLLTLTLQQSDVPLIDQIDHLYQSFRKLRKKAFFSRGTRGGIWFFQVKRSSNGDLWHPHLHCTIDANYIDQRSIADAWEDITRTSRICDIRKVWKLETAATYVSRYAAKPANLKYLNTDQTVELIETMHGRRISGTWGTAACVNLRQQTMSNKEEWVRLCSWRAVSTSYTKCRNARLVYQAWKTGGILENVLRVEGEYSDDTVIAERLSREQKLMPDPYLPGFR